MVEKKRWKNSNVIDRLRLRFSLFVLLGCLSWRVEILPKVVAQPSMELMLDGLISVSFSTWHEEKPQTLNTDEDKSAPSMELEDTILRTLEEFFCDDTEVIMVNKNYTNICSRKLRNTTNILEEQTEGNEAFPQINYTISDPPFSVSDFLARNNDERTYLSDQVMDVVVKRIKDENIDEAVVEWLTWTVQFGVVYLGQTIVEQARVMNITDALRVLDDVVQLALDVSIMEGTMDGRLADKGIRMSMVGLETTTFVREQQSSIDNYVREQNLEYEKRDLIIRCIGAGMLLTNLVVVMTLSLLAKKRRLRRQDEADGLLQKDGHRKSLVNTENEVDSML